MKISKLNIKVLWDAAKIVGIYCCKNPIRKSKKNSNLNCFPHQESSKRAKLKANKRKEMNIRVKAQKKKDKHNRKKFIKMWFFGKKRKEKSTKLTNLLQE